MMRIAPKTPKAGVILVSNKMGVGVGVGEVEEVEEAWIIVLVALNTVGRTVMMVVALFPE